MLRKNRSTLYCAKDMVPQSKLIICLKTEPEPKIHKVFRSIAHSVTRNDVHPSQMFINTCQRLKMIIFFQ